MLGEALFRLGGAYQFSESAHILQQHTIILSCVVKLFSIVSYFCLAIENLLRNQYKQKQTKMCAYARNILYTMNTLGEYSKILNHTKSYSI